MPLDPERVAGTRGWLVRAAEDLRAGAFERTAQPPIATDMVFHAQQAAEKTLKAFLAWYDRPFRRTHDLAELGAACAEIDHTLETHCRQAEPLTVFAWAFRYPGESEAPTSGEADDALDMAKRLYDGVVARLPVETHP